VTAAVAPLAFAMALAAHVESVGSVAPTQERLSIQLAADATVVEALRAHLAPSLAAQYVELDVTPVAAIDIERILATAADRTPDAPLARAWLDGRDPQAAILFLIPRQGDRVLVRKVTLKGGFDAVALAEISYIVERSVASLLAAEPIGVPPAEARVALAQMSIPSSSKGSATPPAAAVTTVAAPPPPASAAARVAYEGGAFGAVTAWASGASAVPSAGITLGLERVGPSARLGLTLAASLRRPFDVAGSPTGVHVGGGDIRLLVTVGRALGGWGIARLGAGPGLAIASVEPTGAGTSNTQTVATQPRTDADPMFSAIARLDVPLGHLASPFIAVTVDVVPVRGEYTAVVNGASRAVFAPWPVRPGLLVGIAFGR
jgi:hypothetical protein